MSGFNPYGNNPQYPGHQGQIYPQLYNPSHSVSEYLGAGQNLHPYTQPQPGFAYPYQPGMQMGQPGIQMRQPGMQMGQPGMQMGQLGMHMGQPGMQMGQPGHPASMSYPQVTPSAPQMPYRYPSHMPQGSSVEWVSTTVRDAHLLSDRAVVAGYEAHDNSPLWVIRSKFQGDLIPGKLAIKHNVAYVAWSGKENAVNNVEVCCSDPARCRWIASRDGLVPLNAVQGGHTQQGEPLYVGRAKEQGSLTPGKIHPSHKVLYISFANKEIAHKQYEVLVTL